MDPQARPPRSTLLAALSEQSVRDELRDIKYVVDLQGNWLADSLIFTADRLEGNLDNLPLAPRQILERHAAADTSVVPIRPSHVPVSPVPRSSGLARTSGAGTWGKPYPDPWVLPRGGTEAWKRMHGMASTPTPTLTPASLMTMPFADSSAIDSPEVYKDDEEDEEDEDDDADGEYEADHDWSHLPSGLPPAMVTAPIPAPTAAAPVAGLPASLIMSPEPAAPSSFVSVGEEYRDEKKDGNKDDRDDTGDEDADAEVAHDTEGEDDEDDESYLSTMPVAHGPAPAPAPATAGSYPTPAPVLALTVSGPAAVAGFPAFPPPATSAPSPAPAPASAAAAAPAAAVPGPAAAGYPAIPPPPNFPPIPAGFQLHRARGRYFLTGPDWTGGAPNPPAMNFLGLRKLAGTANENGACRFCACSKWLWFPAFFQRANDPQGLMHTCTRCVCRDKTSNQKDVGQQEWVRQRNEWLVVNRPIMFWLTRNGV